jgi:hypothetical protein
MRFADLIGSKEGPVPEGQGIVESAKRDGAKGLSYGHR